MYLFALVFSSSSSVDFRTLLCASLFFTTANLQCLPVNNNNDDDNDNDDDTIIAALGFLSALDGR